MPEYMIVADDEAHATFEAPDDAAAIKKMHEWWDRRKNDPDLNEYGITLSRDITNSDFAIVKEITMVREPGIWRRKS